MICGPCGPGEPTKITGSLPAASAGEAEMALNGRKAFVLGLDA
jgi:hypothetical protein